MRQICFQEEQRGLSCPTVYCKAYRPICQSECQLRAQIWEQRGGFDFHPFGDYNQYVGRGVDWRSITPNSVRLENAVLLTWPNC